jgi:hypothetical protein
MAMGYTNGLPRTESGRFGWKPWLRVMFDGIGFEGCVVSVWVRMGSRSRIECRDRLNERRDWKVSHSLADCAHVDSTWLILKTPTSRDKAR